MTMFPLLQPLITYFKNINNSVHNLKLKHHYR